MEYVDIAKAREMEGLRLVLTAGVPGPWGEAAKAILHVKGIEYVPVRQTAGEENAELQVWTGQSSAPVAVWNDEPPYTTSRAILWLAERLAPGLPLVPDDPELRVVCLGVCDEIHGENGLGWCRRLAMFEPMLSAMGEVSRDAPLGFMAWKYGYSADAAERANARILAIVTALGERLRRQQDAGREYLVGNGLTAADLYWAAFAAMLSPMPPEWCPMSDGMRDMYTLREGAVLDALPQALLAHRDLVYERHLPLPMTF